MTTKYYAAVFVSFLAAACFAVPLNLPSIFSDGMVLQRETAVPVWGTARPGAEITVEFARQKKTAVTSDRGTWRVDLDPMTASSEPRALSVSSNLKSEITNRQFSNVLVGEVWLCSGQSNMEWRMDRSENSAQVISAANHPLIRLYHTPKVALQNPGDKIDASWKSCTPESVASFSAVAYYFGRRLHQDLGVPIGLILSAWGGTRIEPWTPPCGFEGIASLSDIHRQALNPPAIANDPRNDRHIPTALYNGMIHAHIPFAIRGATWYQGESNRGDGMLYVDKTRALLNGWRKLWGYDFPFYFVQLAPFQAGSQEPFIAPIFWEAQSEIVKTIPNTGMAVISDATALDDIHPPNKEVPGTRLALLALNKTYGRTDVVCSGPVFETMEILDGKLKLSFSSASGLTTRDGKSPDWFEIAGENGLFKPANASIEGSRILLTSPDVPRPQAVRFAWHKIAVPNLINGAGLPASPFRAGEASEAPAEEALPPVKIPEMDGYRVIYRLIVPATADYSLAPPRYEVDNSGDTAPFSRIAYCLELKKEGEDLQYVFASMESFTGDLKKIGIPTAASGAKFMQKVSGLTVRSNVNGITACTESDGGNIEFWPGNYSAANQEKIPGASETQYDFGDMPSNKIPGYGCLQVHNWKEKQTVFSINKWGNAGTVDIGIGNAPQGHPDWTFSKNGSGYSLRRLTVMVQ